jgi:hypothetical protein
VWLTIYTIKLTIDNYKLGAQFMFGEYLSHIFNRTIKPSINESLLVF